MSCGGIGVGRLHCGSIRTSLVAWIQTEDLEMLCKACIYGDAPPSEEITE